MTVALPDSLVADAEGSAAPGVAAAAFQRLAETNPAAAERLDAEPELRRATVAVVAASDYLGRLCVNDPGALDLVAQEATRAGPLPSPSAPEGDQPEVVAGWKRRGILRIAVRDLIGRDPLEQVGANLSDLADRLCEAGSAAHPGGPRTDLAVVGMGKLGAQELNYGSDIDLLLVGEADPRGLLEVIRAGWRVDLDLRPEGRAGPLVRSLGSYTAYWDRWADVWEFQALLKARPVSGNLALGAAFAAEAAQRVWTRPLDASALRRIRAMKARAEQQVLRRGNDDRDIKTGRGGIRDIEFAIQLLQLVHGSADASLRVRGTLPALAALGAGGYVAADDAATLADAYRFLRTVEHRLQLVDDIQTHLLPRSPAALDRLARVLGFHDGPASAADQFVSRLRRYRYQVRSVHERLFFRPLLEAFTARRDAGPAALTPEAAQERLSAFGFTDANRTRMAVHQLTAGFSRTSRLMEQLLPHLLDWLSQSPDPDLGLLGLRSLAEQRHHQVSLRTVFRDSPEAARQLCTLLGTGPEFARSFGRHPELLRALADGSILAPQQRLGLDKRLDAAVTWRPDAASRAAALRGFVGVERLAIEARDVLSQAKVIDTGRALTDLAEATLEAALREVDPQVPMAIIAMGRFGGAELAYGSDLDVLVVYADDTGGSVLAGTRPPGTGDQPSPAGARAQGARAAAEDAAAALWRLVNGETPAVRLFTLDAGLRPEGRQGPLARSLAAYTTYYRRWAQVWERQALLRGRFAAGDPELGRSFAEVARRFVWDGPFGPEEVRQIRRLKARMETERIPAGEDPQFHLKLGRGSLSDVEWTAQLLQLRSGAGDGPPVAETGTVPALQALAARGLLDEADRDVLVDAYRFCENARNRLYLVRGAPLDALPAAGHDLRVLANSLGTTPAGLRDEYRRVTRRARRVMERLFYGSDSSG